MSSRQPPLSPQIQREINVLKSVRISSKLNSFSLVVFVVVVVVVSVHFFMDDDDGGNVSCTQDIDGRKHTERASKVSMRTKAQLHTNKFMCCISNAKNFVVVVVVVDSDDNQMMTVCFSNLRL